jgi:hypothetical protein
MSLEDRVIPLPDEAAALAERCAALSSDDAFEAARRLARGLGALIEGGTVRFGFWAPELVDWHIPAGDIFVELLASMGTLDLTLARQEVRFERMLLPVARHDAYLFAVAKGVRAGRRDAVGDFYALTWRDADGHWHRILDPLAASLPYGAFAPAEVYDTASLHEDRADRAYWEGLSGEGVRKVGPPVNILQAHVPTATAGGTLASLTRRFREIAARVERGDPPEPADALYLGYDAVQLLPVEPTTVYEAGPAFWTETGEPGEAVTVALIRPDTTNWGYDVVIAGMATVNPVLLETGRPDELVDLAAALHTFPTGPKKLILDVVFGHSDNQGTLALNARYFAGPNMYGQNLSYRDPTVRAILLEMQRRKVDFGADGVRVDGAQDFKFWDPATQTMRHDDAYLQEMADIEQEVCGTRYRPWFVFEDGRPWPEEDWELASTYRSVIETQRDDDVFQWSPLTFAHNPPFLYTFWLSKMWRIREMLEVGAHWITGTANHDTLRRGTQVDPQLNINTRLGETKMEILDRAYDNPAVSMLTYAVFPGVPMDFLNATARASWGFIRNQDDRYGVKVVSEEAISLKWQVDDYSYLVPGNFRRLKDLGFATREELARFFEFLPALVKVTEYHLEQIATLLNAVEPPLAGPGTFTVADLKAIARAWMDDMHEYCNVAHSLPTLDPAQTRFMLELRRFRHANRWLAGNFRDGDRFDYLQPIAGRTVFQAHRRAPDGGEVLVLAQMEGAPAEGLEPAALAPGGDWTVALATPGIAPTGARVDLRDSAGAILTRAGAG